MYLILFVDELLDKLRGAQFFTKLDLRSNYHQVRMNDTNVIETTFHTHHGHFEFLMSFGLTNVPVTFQALMNDILQDFIRHFILVFFDDILIYSDSWGSYLQHVCAVLQRLREHNLAVAQQMLVLGTDDGLSWPCHLRTVCHHGRREGGSGAGVVDVAHSARGPRLPWVNRLLQEIRWSAHQAAQRGRHSAGHLRRQQCSIP
jgi:hypothetical protein